jgi:hypothetical protein
MPRRLQRRRAFKNLLRGAIGKDRRLDTKISEALGMDERKWRRIKNEGRVPPQFELEAICKELRIPIEKMMQAIEHGSLDTLRETFEWHRDPRNYQNVKTLSRNYYASVPGVMHYPSVTRSQWLERQPVPLAEIDEELTSGLAWREELNPQLGKAYLDLLEGRTYSEFVGSVAPNVRQDDNFCYRLLEVTRTDNVHFTFGPTRYQNFVNTCEALTFEVGQWCFDHDPVRKAPRTNGLDLPARGPASDVFSFRKRSCAVGICTVLILKKPNGHFFYLQNRDISPTGPQLMEATGGFHVVPSGTFQPDTGEDENHSRDFSLTRSIMRELAEELLGIKEVRETIDASKDFMTHPRLKEYAVGLQNGSVRGYFLGITMHPPSAKPDLLTVLIVDTAKFSDDSLRFIGNWEMKKQIHEARIENLERWVKDERMAPTGATCLALVLEHFKENRLTLPS